MTEEKKIERNRIYIGDIYFDNSNGKDLQNDKNFKKIKHQVLLISFGNYFVEFNNVKSRYHFSQLEAYANNKTDLIEDEHSLFMVSKAIANRPYFVKNLKHFFTFRTGDVSYSDLLSLAVYCAPAPDMCF